MHLDDGALPAPWSYLADDAKRHQEYEAHPGCLGGQTGLCRTSSRPSDPHSVFGGGGDLLVDLHYS